MIASPQANLTPKPHADEPQGLTYRPNVDIVDNGGELVLAADMPGSAADQIEVSFDDGVLTISAPVPARSHPGNPVRQEYGVGDYRRSFQLGDGFDASEIAADYRSGVLTVRVPRQAAVRSRTIPVSTG